MPSPAESDASQADYGFITIVEQTNASQAEPLKGNTVASKEKCASVVKTRIFQITDSLGNMVQSARNQICPSRTIDYNQPGGLECLSVALISALVLIYFIGFLCSGIVGLGLWSHVFRPDMADADGVSAFWGGAFLATSAFCNNGMSLITTNMGPLQRE